MSKLLAIKYTARPLPVRVYLPDSSPQRPPTARDGSTIEHKRLNVKVEVDCDLKREGMKPDVGFIVAVQRNQTGANIHKLNNLLNQYVWACHAKNNKVADRAKHDLMAVVIERD